MPVSIARVLKCTAPIGGDYMPVRGAPPPGTRARTVVSLRRLGTGGPVLTRHLGRSVAFLAAVVSLAWGCAHGGPVLVSPGGELQVTNGTGEEVEVFVDGQHVAVLADGATTLIDRLDSGERDLLAVGKLSGSRLTYHVTLHSGRVATWRIGP